MLDLNELDILNFDLYLCSKDKGYIWGLNGEYFSSPRIDDLQCAYTSLRGFINSDNEQIQRKTEYLNKELSELKINQK